MVSLKDIAKQCGVSVATVSKALNNRNDIGEETKRQIQQIAEDMGYLPNSSARALKTNRTYNLGVLFVDEAMSGLTHSYFSHVLDSFKRTVEEKGYDITFISTRTGERSMSYYEHSKYRGVDGVIIACVAFEEASVVELVNSEIPVVTIDYEFNNRTSIVSDNAKGMKDLTNYIISMGHKKIAYIHGEDKLSVTRNRLGSFYKTTLDHDIKVPNDYVKEANYHNTDSSAERTEELLALTDRPTCIIYPDDFSCIGGINVIKSHGLHIPNDISIAGYDGQRIAWVMEPKITTIKQDTLEIGRKAAEKLVELVERPKASMVERIVVEGELVKGKSVKELNKDK